MRFQRKKRVIPEISMTSMVDVVLLLLFFFMVSTTFNRNTQIKIKLPEANGEEAEEVKESISLIIDAGGVYYLQGEDGVPHQLANQTIETLEQALRKASIQIEQTPLIIDADAKTPHQSVIRALEAASVTGYHQITFAAERKPAS